MAILLLVRHGRTRGNADGVLVGWTPGVGLDEVGRAQAEALAGRLSEIDPARVVSSPLQRCRETAAALTEGRKTADPEHSAEPIIDECLGEVHYGDWQGRKLSELAKEELWPVVQQHPSAVVFPGEGGESMSAMAQRAVGAVRRIDAEVHAAHGQDAIWLAVSHGDVIKAIVADALGLHLDQFQRIVVDPCSVTVIRYTPLRPFVIRTNDIGGDLTALVRLERAESEAEPDAPRDAVAESDAAVGGGVGSVS